MSKDLSDCEIILTNYKWDLWYPNYIKYKQSRDEKFEYSFTLTPKKKRQLMTAWIKNSKIDFCFPNKETFIYNLPSSPEVSYETRRKLNKPWRVNYMGKFLGYYQTFDEAIEARKQKHYYSSDDYDDYDDLIKELNTYMITKQIKTKD